MLFVFVVSVVVFLFGVHTHACAHTRIHCECLFFLQLFRMARCSGLLTRFWFVCVWCMLCKCFCDCIRIFEHFYLYCTGYRLAMCIAKVLSCHFVHWMQDVQQVIAVHLCVPIRNGFVDLCSSVWVEACVCVRVLVCCASIFVKSLRFVAKRVIGAISMVLITSASINSTILVWNCFFPIQIILFLY